MEKIQLIVGKKKYDVPELSFSRESDYIKALMQSGMVETLTKQVSLPTFEESAMDFVVHFIDTDTLEKFNIANLEQIMEVVSYLQMENCASRITKLLEESMTVDNCWKLRKIGSEFYNKDLETFAEDFLSSHIKEFSETQDFQELSIEDVIDIFERENLFTNGEKELFDIAIKYLSKANCYASEEKIALFRRIRFPLIQGNQFTECVETLKAVGLYNECKDDIEEARDYHKNPYIVHKCMKKSFRPRRLVPCVVAIGGFTGKEHSTNRFQVMPFNELQSIISSGESDMDFRSIKQPKENSVSGKVSHKLLKLPTALCEHCVCVLDNFLFVAGGQTQYCQDGRYTRNTVFRFDPSNASWLEVCPMQTPRSLFFLGCMEGKLYAVGGWTAPDTVTRRVECYYPAENRWTSLALLPLGLHEHAGCVVNEVMYVSGGYKGPYRGHLDNLWRYNRETDSWLEHKAMNQARSYHSMVPMGKNKILVAGGVNYFTEVDEFKDVKDCEIYDIETDSWSTITQTLKCTSCAPTLSFGDTMAVFGGHSFEEENDHNSVQILNLTSLSWQENRVHANSILYFATAILHFREYFLKSCKIL